ncbi:MAG: hypothetical protein CEO12_382 [Parcubacteria group bacterium Gr01-1014_46]|nr:MAG: hypothetical protein CEO12_382 [Parcubacteria group bacterium Gr01-1014_46]
MPEEKKGNGVLIGVIVVLILAVAGYGVFKYVKKDSKYEIEVMPPVVPPSYMYKDGTYNSKGSYNSPNGTEQIDVTIVVKSDVITDATVVSLASNPTSKTMQGKFISGIKAEVVGKKLSEVTLTKVSGSSLTPKGWNDAVAKIQAQAQA